MDARADRCQQMLQASRQMDASKQASSTEVVYHGQAPPRLEAQVWP